MELKQALEAKRVVSFTYHEKVRIVEPHALGLNKSGEGLMRAWQQDEGWKLFKTAEIEDLELTDIVSEAPRPGYKPGDRALKSIVAELG